MSRYIKLIYIFHWLHSLLWTSNELCNFADKKYIYISFWNYTKKFEILSFSQDLGCWSLCGDQNNLCPKSDVEIICTSFHLWCDDYVFITNIFNSPCWIDYSWITFCKTKQTQITGNAAAMLYYFTFFYFFIIQTLNDYFCD